MPEISDEELIKMVRENKISSAKGRKQIYEARAVNTGRASSASKSKSKGKGVLSKLFGRGKTTKKKAKPKAKPKSKSNEIGFLETLFGAPPPQKKRTVKKRKPVETDNDVEYETERKTSTRAKSSTTRTKATKSTSTTTKKATTKNTTKAATKNTTKAATKSVAKAKPATRKPATSTRTTTKSTTTKPAKGKPVKKSSANTIDTDNLQTNTRERERLQKLFNSKIDQETTGEIYGKPHSKILLVPRSEVTKLDITNALTFFKNWEKFPAEARQELRIQFPNHDELAFPSWACTEVRKYMSKLVRKCKHILYFIHPDQLVDIVSSVIVIQSFSTGEHMDGIDYTKKKTGFMARVDDINRIISSDQLEDLLGAVGDFGLTVKDQKGAKKVNDELLRLFFGDDVKY
ncbi:hypothetical protein ABGV42_00435 [Paenibacillus pabuli]|uniref:hypothetical protein n=1 Tax=Paenibacillus pabuli TaxID=1472 RepID=UPI00324203BF